MDNNNAMRKWSDMKGLAVVVPKQGKTIGTVEDYFFKEGTNAIYSLRVHTRLLGDYSLPVIALKTIESDKVTIDNAEMLIKALPSHPQIQSLIGRKVVDESGKEIGTIGEVWIGTNPPRALHIAALELAGGSRGNRHVTFTADAVAFYEDDTIVIHDQVARRLR